MEITDTGEIKLSSNHMVLPSSIAIAALGCYYHGAPRHGEKQSATREPDAEPGESVPDAPKFPEWIEPMGFAKEMNDAESADSSEGQ